MWTTCVVEWKISNKNKLLIFLANTNDFDFG